MPENGSQHFVAKSYQNAWLDPNTPEGQTPYVWVFPKDGGEPRRKAPKNLFEKTDFYTIPLPDGGRDLTWEKALSGIEGDFVSLRDDVLAVRQPITNWVKWRLAMLTAVTRSRVAKTRDHYVRQFQNIANMFEMVERGAKEAIERGEEIRGPFSHLAPEERSGNWAEYDPDTMQAMIEQPMPLLLRSGVEGMVPFLREMHLAVLCTASDPGFITADAPCALFDPERANINLGMTSPTLEVSFPISPRQAALFTHGPMAGYVEAPSDLVHEINRRTRTGAQQYFISQRPDADPSAYGFPSTSPDVAE